MNKKAQITILIIIGIIILFSFALINYMKHRIRTAQIQPEAIQEKVPLEAQPIQDYVTRCLKDTTIDALKRIGQNGGYIYPKNVNTNNNNPTEANSIEFLKGITLPYWWYMSSPNNCNENCQFSSKMPKLYKTSDYDGSIQSQIERYVEENIYNCINDFEPFKKDRTINELSKPKATLYIGARNDTYNSLTITLEWPLRIISGNNEITIKRFSDKIDLDLKRIYELAKLIRNKEIKTQFLEFGAMNTIVDYSNVKPDKLPPISGIVFSRRGITWNMYDVKEKIRQMLTAYIPVITVLNTSSFRLPYYGQDQLKRGIFQMFILPLEKRYNIDVNFIYLSWNPYLDITPNDGSIIKPRVMQIPIPILKNIIPGIYQYKFAYDLSFPAVIELRDRRAFNNEGYTFRYALEANLRNNEPMNTSTVTTGMYFGEGSTMFCDSTGWDSGNITVKVIDGRTGQPVGDAVVEFSSGSESCTIGATNESGILKSKFPIGIGLIKVYKSNYYTDVEPFATGLDNKNITIELEPYRNITIKVKKRIVEKMFFNLWYLSNKTENITKDEEVIVMLERVKDHSYDEDFTPRPVRYYNETNGTQNKTMNLIPGKYSVNIMDLLHLGDGHSIDEIYIPYEHKCSGGFLGFGEKCYDLDPITFDDKFPLGILRLDNTTRYFEISKDKLDSIKEITFYIVAVNASQIETHDDLSQMMNTSYIKTNYSLFVPELR